MAISLKFAKNTEDNLCQEKEKTSTKERTDAGKRYTSDCRLDGVHFHTLRHTFATRCVEVGFEIKSLSEILGHANPKITLERYIHSSLELKRNNMNKLEKIGF